MAKRSLEVAEECFRSVRDRLYLAPSAENRGPQTMLLTGAGAGDGTSTAAVGLAKSLAALNGKKTVLVDANLWAPTIHDSLSLNRMPGLTDVLTNASSTTDAVQLSGSLSVLAAGSHHADPVVPLTGIPLSELIEELKEIFDYLVIDSPPVLHCVGAQMLAPYVDCVLLVIESDKTRLQAAQKARDTIQRAGATVCGVLLNRYSSHVPGWLMRPDV
ncbi:MAG: CpsD/CapB family tyrosine-protein kinase [Armatimonadetes bacterium]|nr:CpsD/CapB family tyrosine-protein kinase [Armatimonadota bacterium]